MLAKLMHQKLSKYFLISCFASVIDLCIANSLYSLVNINYLIACNLGIAAGFLFQYYVGMKFVFTQSSGTSSFFIYLGTFALGLLLASGTMWSSFEILTLPFIWAKLLSMLVPFFITYFVRKTLLDLQRGGNVKHENLI